MRIVRGVYNPPNCRDLAEVRMPVILRDRVLCDRFSRVGRIWGTVELRAHGLLEFLSPAGETIQSRYADVRWAVMEPEPETRVRLKLRNRNGFSMGLLEFVISGSLMHRTLWRTTLE